VVEQVDRLAGEQLVAGMIRADVDADAPAAVEQPKGQPGQLRGQAWGEGEDVAVIAQAAESGDHDVQGAGSTVLRPFQVAATRVAQPFRDAYDYIHGLANAKSENKRLREQNRKLRARDIHTVALAAQVPGLKRLLHFEQSRTFPGAYRAINTAVIVPPGGPFAHSMTIDRGSSSGVQLNAPVVSGAALVGHVTNVFPDTSVVTLLTDPNSFVAAFDPRTNVRGGMLHTGPGGTLILDQVNKQLRVNKGDVLVTAGTHNARYPDLYPYGIPIGRVLSVGATDTATFLQVQVQPYANLGSLDAVAVLVPKKQRR